MLISHRTDSTFSEVEIGQPFWCDGMLYIKAHDPLRDMATKHGIAVEDFGRNALQVYSGRLWSFEPEDPVRKVEAEIHLKSLMTKAELKTE